MKIRIAAGIAVAALAVAGCGGSAAHPASSGWTTSLAPGLHALPSTPPAASSTPQLPTSSATPGDEPGGTFADEGLPPGASTTVILGHVLAPQVENSYTYDTAQQLTISNNAPGAPPDGVFTSVAGAEAACWSVINSDGPGASSPSALSFMLGCTGGNYPYGPGAGYGVAPGS